MDYRFFDDFKSCDQRNRACNWTVLQTSDLAHLHRQWKSGKYIITAPGNRHLPNTPELDEFALEIAFGIKDNLTDPPELRIFFWYEELKRAGYFVDCRLEEKQCIVSFGSEHNNTTRIISKQSKPFDWQCEQSSWTVSLEIKQDQIYFRFENCQLFNFSLPEVNNRKGRIAFDRAGSSGVLEIHQIKITSADEIDTKVLLPETQIVFPPDINGFHTPLRYNVQITQFGDTARLDLEIAGSDAENPDVPWFPYHGLIIDFLTAPYLRIGEKRFYPVAQDVLVLANPDPVKHEYFYETLYKKPEWPLRASFFLAKIPEDDTIAVGYEYCEIEVSGNHLASGPNEAIFDLATNTIAYSGAAVRKGKFILELHSQPEKEVCKHIPKTDPQYEAALAFARRNHFFIAPESCRFKVILRSKGNEFSTEDISLSCKLENAFMEELETLAISSFETVENTKLGVTEFITELPSFTLKPGVYHLYFEVKFAGQNIISERHAFEIMSADPDALAAPLLSGLPLLFTMANETKGLEKDQFEPYLNVENNVAHYLSLTTHYPAVGRKHRVADVLKIYHRKWFLWLTDRVTEYPEIDLHHDIIGQCDFIHPPRTEPVYEMWKPGTYSGAVLDMLIKFLESDEFYSNNEKSLTLENLQNISREKVLFPEAAIEELVASHWMPWLRFFEKWNLAENIALQKKLQEINPQIKRATYGPMNIYVTHGKTNHVLKYRGNMPQFNDGFFVFEDYPHSCKYNIHRGPFLLAAFKMAAPDTKIYPEIYRSIRQGCPDGAVGYAWPPLGTATHPAIAEKKRFLEYAYAAVWFKQGKFHYWQDNGYHAAAWPREYYDVMLESWKFIHQAKPLKPLRSIAYVYSDVVCENHPAFYERFTGYGLPWGDIYNTAEETIPYAWETARIDGQQSGFLCELESLHEISAADTGLLVLPPLNGVTQTQLDAIRSLHEQGVNLLAFENIEGLEDIFGVEQMEEPLAVNNIWVNGSLLDNPLKVLGTLKEYTEHSLCSAKYRANGATVLLDGEVPVLLMNQTSSGKSALFNIPPTVVRRDAFYERVAYGRGSISELMNRSVAIMQRELGAPTVTTTAGKIVAFEAQNGERHVIVEEDAFPDDGVTITPLVTIYLPDINMQKVSCDKPFQILLYDSNMIKIRLKLNVHECAIITISKTASTKKMP